MMIGVDWGTSNCRAFRFDKAGAVVDKRASERGITTVEPGAFPDVLGELIGDWADGRTPIVLAGMVGSRNGWAEAPYLACPAEPQALAGAAIALETALGPAWIVPGLSHLHADGSADVMRGEETQLFGVDLSRDGLVIAPGTHSKWARIEGGRIVGFRTYMTGELFAVLRQHSILGRLMEPADAFDEVAFTLGVERALRDPAITALLFGVRTEGLFGHVPATGLADYLSGLLLGAEIAAGLAQAGGAPDAITVIATSALAERYRIALDLSEAPAPTIIEGDAAAARGLWAIGARLMGE